MRDLLKSLSTLSEAETKDTKTGRVHKGDYGTSYEAGDEGAKKQETTRGRGRPKKDADETGEVKKYDTKSVGNVFGAGKKPKKEVGTVSKKHSLKEYMEAAEEAILEGTTIEKKGGRVHKGSYGTSYEAGDEGVKKAQTQRGRGRPKKDADETGEVKKYDTKSLSAAFGGGKAPKKAVGKVSASHKLKEEGTELDIKPIPGASQITDKEGNTLGTADAATANVMKQAAAQGKLTIGGQKQPGMNEAAKPDFLDVDKDKNKKESFKKAVKDKEDNKEKVKESRDHSTSEYTYEKVAKILAREKPGMDTNKSSDDFYSAVYHELVALGMTPKSANSLMNYDEDFMSDVASAYAHYQANPGLDEDAIKDFAIHGVKPTNDFTRTGTSMAAPKGTPTTANRPVANPTPFGTDPIAATTDRALNFISGLRKPSNPFSESTTMKDVQVESWAKQLNTILSEGITVSSSQGQQGAPDSVTITATEGDSEQLLSVLRNAGIGVFGGDEKPQMGYGVVSQGEEDFDGTGTQPQPAPGVVGDGDDMLSMMKKMAGIEDGTSGAEQGGQDYEDEEGSEGGALEPTTGGEEEGSDEQDSDEEVTDEGEVGQAVGTAVGRVAGAELGPVGSAVGGAIGGAAGDAIGDAFGGDEDEVEEGNAFTGKLKQTQQGQNFKMGDKSYKDTSEIEEGSDCEVCHEAQCKCDSEKVEENFANSANDSAETELAQLRALLSMGNDMHKIKHSQAMGNPVKVTMETKLMNQSTGLLADYKKLSGL